MRTLILLMVACSSPRTPTAGSGEGLVPKPPEGTAVDAVVARGDDAPSPFETFYSFFGNFCAAVDAKDTAFLHAHVQFPIAMRTLVNGEACSSAATQPCRYRTTSLTGPSDLYASHVCQRSTGTFEERFPRSAVRHVDASGHANDHWVVREEVGQFGTWIWFERSGATYQLVRYADDAAP